jgi:hypothetical protein
MRWINANQLENWARSLSARTELPKVVSDLIRASSDDIATMRFPSGDKGQVRGFDGHLVSRIAEFNVPEGKSYWEFGTNADYKAKATSDFDKRTAEVSSADQAQTTFVFVSPWTWDSSDPNNKLEDWINACKARSAWKDVRYIDGSALETWLEHRPAVSAWHARNTLGVHPLEGLRSTEEFWRDFSGQFGPPLSEEVVICERDNAAQQLINDLLQPGNSVSLVADSPDEVVAFAIAAIRKAPSDIRLFLEARTLVVDSTAAGRQLSANSDLILLLRNDAARSPGQFSIIGSTLVPLGRQQRGKGTPILNRPSGYALGTAMKSMGLEANRALTLARGSGRSLTVLARLIPSGASVEPAWLTEGASLLPAILAGAWDSSNSLDLGIVEKLAGGTPYSQIERSIRTFLRNSDPPFDLEGSVWKVRAPMDAFVRVGPLIGTEEAKLFREAMLAVFSKLDDPIDPDEIIGSTQTDSRYSDWLKDGLATTLLLLAVWSEPAEVSLGAVTGQEFANQLLNDLPGLGSDHRVLTSLKNELPLLAEAAPDPLLQALEHMLEGTGELIRPIFDEQKGFFSPSYGHTGILWALETLAWDTDYFRRTVLVLAGLANISPDISIVNTPAQSLTEIFVLWNPNTNASTSQRLSALEEIIARYPEVGWELIFSLLPKSHAVSRPTSKPKLREAGASDRPPVTYRELWDNQAAVAKLAIGLAGANASRWIKLIPTIGAFAPTERELAISALDSFMSHLSSGDLKPIWFKLRDEVARHERFKTTDWALPADQLEPLRDLALKYAPSDPITPLVVLFNSRVLDETTDLTNGSNRRAAALQRLYNDFGPEAVLRLAAEVRVPYLIVEAINGVSLSATQVEELLLLSLQTPRSTIALGLINLHRRLVGLARAEAFLRTAISTNSNSVEEIADFLLAWPDDPDTWNAVRRFGPGVVKSYWSRHSARYLQGSRTTLLRFLLALLRHGKAIEAIESSFDRLSELPTRLLFKMLDEVVPQLNSGTPTSEPAYYVEKVFETLDGRPDATIQDIATREYAFLPLLEFGERSLRVHVVMADEPQFYHKILRDVFKADSDAENELTENDKTRARLSYSLLSNFARLPGTTSDSIDQHILSTWIDAVRTLGVETDRSAVTDNYVGRLLAHAPVDADGGWPHRAVRHEIERLRSDEIERGLRLQRYNMRGVYTKQMFEGGEQERALANEYAESAALAAAWPRTAALLKAIAKGWQREADSEDVEAAKRKLRS